MSRRTGFSIDGPTTKSVVDFRVVDVFSLYAFLIQAKTAAADRNIYELYSIAI